MWAYAIFAITFVLFLILALLYLYPTSKKKTTIPGLNPNSEEDGNLSDIQSAGSLHEFLLSLHKRFGPIASFWMGSELVVSTASPELFLEQRKMFDRPASVFKLFEPMIGKDSIQYSNHFQGRLKRKLYDVAYSHQSIESYYECIQKVTDEVVAKWSSMLNADHIPLSQYMMALIIKVNGLVTMGQSIDDETIHQLHKCYNTAWHEMEETLITGTAEEGSDREKQFQNALEKFKSIVQKMISIRKDMKGGDVSNDSFLDVLVKSGLSDDTVMSDAITYLVGGFHTTGNLLTWALYFLASHPDIQERAADEVKVQLADDNVDHTNINSLVYLRQIIDETLRCSVLAPYAARYQEVDTFFGGHLIPANTPVIQALGVVLQDEIYWPLPNRFDPDRFEESNISNIPKMAFQPFGFAGKRKCPGYRLAYTEGTIVLATVLKHFRIQLVEGQVVTPVYRLVTSPSEEIWIHLEKRH